MSFDDVTLYGRNEDEEDFGDMASSYGDATEEYEEEEEEETTEPSGGAGSAPGSFGEPAGSGLGEPSGSNGKPARKSGGTIGECLRVYCWRDAPTR